MLLKKYLWQTKVRTPNFYVTPKVYKKDILGRPVVTSIDCYTSKISKFVDQYLQPHAKFLPFYVEGTADFINKLAKVKYKSTNSNLVTLDVRAFCTNVFNHKCRSCERNT